MTLFRRPNIGSIIFLFLSWLIPTTQLFSGIHEAPIIIPGFKVRQLTKFPINSYRLYRAKRDGKAQLIPFQIDEINNIGDYVLDNGLLPNNKTGNGIFDLYDELSFMGNDVGVSQIPTSWPYSKPDFVYELKFSNFSKSKNSSGSVFIGVHLSSPPPLVNQKYVVYQQKAAKILTSRYLYEFDKKNYLILKKVHTTVKDSNNGFKKTNPVLDSSTFYLKADLKYFLTVEANHRSLDSKIEAYKTGPIRTIIRISFFYSFLKLNFELGMYTEVSFFSNSVILPAVIQNPLNGKENLNDGSGFYYGFTLSENPKSYDIETNMEPYPPKKNLLDFFDSKKDLKNKYWISLIAPDKMIYVELKPSKKMLKNKNIPYLYRNNQPGSKLLSIPNNTPQPITKSPINIGLFFDLTRFDEGEQFMSFQLFFENHKKKENIETFKNLSDWNYYTRKCKLPHSKNERDVPSKH